MQSAVAIVILVASSETLLAMRIPIVFHCRQSRRIEDRQNPSKHTGKQRKGRILIVVYWRQEFDATRFVFGRALF